MLSNADVTMTISDDHVTQSNTFCLENEIENNLSDAYRAEISKCHRQSHCLINSMPWMDDSSHNSPFNPDNSFPFIYYTKENEKFEEPTKDLSKSVLIDLHRISPNYELNVPEYQVSTASSTRKNRQPPSPSSPPAPSYNILLARNSLVESSVQTPELRERSSSSNWSFLQRYFLPCYWFSKKNSTKFSNGQTFNPTANIPRIRINSRDSTPSGHHLNGGKMLTDRYAGEQFENHEIISLGDKTQGKTTSTSRSR